MSNAALMAMHGSGKWTESRLVEGEVVPPAPLLLTLLMPST
jgi:hypothetical protein